ncbi:hypothetical protein [Bacillus pseudomycoides]|uniref:hypothetical protein n=1 Tax=Bacillus pseudomycoides TaxID=64104 RepID=UPI00159BB2EE|nr:hypothetical protein [Bacillus pseudomycoides]
MKLKAIKIVLATAIIACVGILPVHSEKEVAKQSDTPIEYRMMVDPGAGGG